MEPQLNVTSFDQDNDTVRYYIVGGNDNNGYPAFQVDADTGALATWVTIDYETGPRFYQLQVSMGGGGWQCVDACDVGTFLCC
jgi:hypothetical protein